MPNHVASTPSSENKNAKLEQIYEETTWTCDTQIAGRGGEQDAGTRAPVNPEDQTQQSKREELVACKEELLEIGSQDDQTQQGYFGKFD